MNVNVLSSRAFHVVSLSNLRHVVCACLSVGRCHDSKTPDLILAGHANSLDRQGSADKNG